MHSISHSLNSIIKRFSDFVVNILLNDLILTCAVFTDYRRSKTKSFEISINWTCLNNWIWLKKQDQRSITEQSEVLIDQIEWNLDKKINCFVERTNWDFLPISRMSVRLSFADFVLWKSEETFVSLLTNGVLFEDDVICGCTTEIITPKEKLPPYHDINFPYFQKNIDILNTKHQRAEYCFHLTFYTQRLLIIMVTVYMSIWISCKCTCTRKSSKRKGVKI